jgi:hypothetical protein
MFKVNEYFEGKVKSLGFSSEKGNATIGVMAAGEYEFGTSTVEYMTVTSGKMEYMLPDDTMWKICNEFETFTVPANIRFKVKVSADTSYRCLYK